MISVTITREQLTDRRACGSGLALFDDIAPEGVLHIPEWTPLHDLWLAASGHAAWLIWQRLVPIANLEHHNLRSLPLARAQLRYACFREADLRSADLTDADLEGACLRKANLADANLTEAFLYRTDLTNADLRNTRFDGTEFGGAHLTGALRHAEDTPIPGWVVIGGQLQKELL